MNADVGSNKKAGSGRGAVTKAVLPAAGFGTRFLPATKASPKEMLPIVDKPLIQYAAEECLDCNLTDVVVITGKNKRSIEDHFDSACELEELLDKKGKTRMLDCLNDLASLNFAYIRQKQALGLGHAVLCARPCVGEESFAVILSDDLLPRDSGVMKRMLEISAEKDGAPVVCVMRVEESEIHNYGVIAGKEESPGLYRLEGIVEKPQASEAPSNMAVIGRYVLTSDIFDILETQPTGKGGEIQLTDAIETLSRRRPVYAFLYEGRRYDAGSKIGFLEATVEKALKNPEVAEDFRAFLLEVARRLETEKRAGV